MSLNYLKYFRGWVKAMQKSQYYFCSSVTCHMAEITLAHQDTLEEEQGLP